MRFGSTAKVLAKCKLEYNLRVPHVFLPLSVHDMHLMAPKFLSQAGKALCGCTGVI